MLGILVMTGSVMNGHAPLNTVVPIREQCARVIDKILSILTKEYCTPSQALHVQQSVQALKCARSVRSGKDGVF